MLADPQSVTINGVANSLPRVVQEALSATYQNTDESVVLTVTHVNTKAGRVRSTVRLDQRKIVTSPLDSTNDYDTTSIQFIIDRPSYGFSNLDVRYLKNALTGFLTDATVDKLFGKES